MSRSFIVISFVSSSRCLYSLVIAIRYTIERKHTGQSGSSSGEGRINNSRHRGLNRRGIDLLEVLPGLLSSTYLNFRSRSLLHNKNVIWKQTRQNSIHISNNGECLVQLHNRHVHATKTIFHSIELLSLLITQVTSSLDLIQRLTINIREIHLQPSSALHPFDVIGG